MNKFCVVRYTTAEQRSSVLANIERFADDEVPYHIGRRYVVEYPDHHLILYSAESFTSPFDDFDQVFVSRSAFCAFDGFPVFKGQNVKAHWAERLFRHFRKQALSSFYRTTLGNHCTVAFRDGVVTALSDFSGASPLFTYSRDGICAISNRQRMLHRVVNESGRIDIDPLALAWLVDQANIFGEDSPYRGVKLLAPGRFARLGAEGLTFGGFQRFYLPDSRVGEPSPELIRRAVDAIYEQATLTAELPFNELVMDLTGGMDSRAVLAIAMGTGMMDRVSVIRTVGPEAAPDIQVAQNIARELNLSWEALVQQPASATDDELVERNWDKLRGNVGALDGTIMAGDGYGGTAQNSYLCLTGSAGEIYRPHIKRRRSLTLSNLEGAKREYQHYHYRSNPVGLLRPEIAARNRAYFRAKVSGLHRQGVPFDDMHYAFYVEDRMSWWNGYAMSNMFGRARINPLANFDAASIMSSVDPEQKKMDRLHFELMKAVDPRLLSLPFLSNQWDSRLQQYAGGHTLAEVPMKITVQDELRNRKPHLFALAEARWDQIFSMVLDSPNSILFDALSRDRIEELYGFPDNLPGATVRFILTLAQMVMLEQGDWMLVKQGQQPTPEEYMSVRHIFAGT